MATALCDLPVGAVPIDFAYRIHTDVGNRCVGAKVNGRIVPLDYKLSNGDIVEVITSKQAAGPSRDWLNIVGSSDSRNKIKSWFKKERREENIIKGREMLEKECKRLGYDTKILLKSDKLKDVSAQLRFYVEEEEDFNRDFLISKVLQYYPDRVIIEYNGMWSVERMMTEMDDTPLLVFQTIVTVNGETFDLYMNNMRSLAVEMYKIAEMVIINRCTAEMPRATWRRSIKAVNRRAQVLFESVDDDDMGEEDDTLPFDIEGDEIHLEDEDYGIWFVDAMERPEVYDGKTMVMKTRVFKSIRLPKGCFVPGRHAMTCCVVSLNFSPLILQELAMISFTFSSKSSWSSLNSSSTMMGSGSTAPKP